MKKMLLALSCALFLAGCATDNSVDYSSEMDDTYSTSNYNPNSAYNLPRSSYYKDVYVPTSRAKNKAKVPLPKLTPSKTVKSLPSLGSSAQTKAATPKAAAVKATPKKTAKSLPVLDTGTLSKIKATPLATPTKAAKSKKTAQCPVIVKYKYITKVVTKKPAAKPVQKKQKTAKTKAKKK